MAWSDLEIPFSSQIGDVGDNYNFGCDASPATCKITSLT
jgi:hypothetical protein